MKNLSRSFTKIADVRARRLALHDTIAADDEQRDPFRHLRLARHHGGRFHFRRSAACFRSHRDHVRSKNKSPQILIGYDTRCFSDAFALASAGILKSRGCAVSVTEGPAPTPAIAYESVRRKLDGAVNVTASHNPASLQRAEIFGAERRASAARDHSRYRSACRTIRARRVRRAEPGIERFVYSRADPRRLPRAAGRIGAIRRAEEGEGRIRLRRCAWLRRWMARSRTIGSWRHCYSNSRRARRPIRRRRARSFRRKSRTPAKDGAREKSTSRTGHRRRRRSLRHPRPRRQFIFRQITFSLCSSTT